MSNYMKQFNEQFGEAIEGKPTEFSVKADVDVDDRRFDDMHDVLDECGGWDYVEMGKMR